jgi:hypothetical protein
MILMELVLVMKDVFVKIILLFLVLMIVIDLTIQSHGHANHLIIKLTILVFVLEIL